MNFVRFNIQYAIRDFLDIYFLLYAHNINNFSIAGIFSIWTKTVSSVRW